MKALLTILVLALGCIAPAAFPQTTIDSKQGMAWGANLGWCSFSADGTNGAVIGEYVCSGWIYDANVGWISLGGGQPANHIYYQNNAANDYGVNFQPVAPGVANLRGYAYGANIGWVNFEAQGNPRISLLTGRFSGYAWSANCGWINLGDVTSYVQTDRIRPGIDADGDGIADAWEYLYFGNLTTANAATSYLGDGATDLEKYLAGVSPLSSGLDLRILSVTVAPSGTQVGITFTSNFSRLYRIEKTPDLASWTDSGLGLFAPDPAATTSRMFSGAATAKEFFRVRALRPLP